jgi:hypothetical protein
MPRRLLCLLAVIGCSSPSVVKKPDVNTPRERDPAIEDWLKARLAWRDAQPHPPLPFSPPLLPPPPNTFDWVRVRFLWELRPREMPCDGCYMGPPGIGWCCFPGRKPRRAARAKPWRIVDSSHTLLKLDIGSEALITKEWYAALVDEYDYLITEWVQLKEVRRQDSLVVLPVGYQQIDGQTLRVALVEELPE